MKCHNLKWPWRGFKGLLPLCALEKKNPMYVLNRKTVLLQVWRDEGNECAVNVVSQPCLRWPAENTQGKLLVWFCVGETCSHMRCKHVQVTHFPDFYCRLSDYSCKKGCFKFPLNTYWAHDPQNNSARDWGPPSTLEVAYNVKHSIRTIRQTGIDHKKDNSLTAIILF